MGVYFHNCYNRLWGLFIIDSYYNDLYFFFLTMVINRKLTAFILYFTYILVKHRNFVLMLYYLNFEPK